MVGKSGSQRFGGLELNAREKFILSPGVEESNSPFLIVGKSESRGFGGLELNAREKLILSPGVEESKSQYEI